MRRKNVVPPVEEVKEEQVQEGVVLSDEDIDKVLGLIKSGKSLKEIGETLAPPPKRRRRSPAQMAADAAALAAATAEKPKSAVTNMPSSVPPAIIQKIEVQQRPVVDLKIDWLVDNKRYSLGATRPLPEGMDIKTAHEQLYGELLISMDNLVEITKEAKDTTTK